MWYARPALLTLLGAKLISSAIEVNNIGSIRYKQARWIRISCDVINEHGSLYDCFKIEITVYNNVTYDVLKRLNLNILGAGPAERSAKGGKQREDPQDSIFTSQLQPYYMGWSIKRAQKRPAMSRSK